MTILTTFVLLHWPKQRLFTRHSSNSCSLQTKTNGCRYFIAKARPKATQSNTSQMIKELTNEMKICVFYRIDVKDTHKRAEFVLGNFYVLCVFCVATVCVFDAYCRDKFTVIRFSDQKKKLFGKRIKWKGKKLLSSLIASRLSTSMNFLMLDPFQCDFVNAENSSKRVSYYNQEKIFHHILRLKMHDVHFLPILLK